MSRWAGLSGDGERRENPRPPGEWKLENGNEGVWCNRNLAGEEGQRDRLKLAGSD